MVFDFQSARRRKEEEKYSHLASLKEVEQNDYNLNIPRYVDTFDEEEQIDIIEVAKELKSLGEEMKQTDMHLAAFCKELNIEMPF